MEVHVQKWSSKTPHSHGYYTASYSSYGIDDHNYCRNPSNYAGVYGVTPPTELNDGRSVTQFKLTQRLQQVSLYLCFPDITDGILCNRF